MISLRGTIKYNHATKFLGILTFLKMCSKDYFMTQRDNEQAYEKYEIEVCFRHGISYIL